MDFPFATPEATCGTWLGESMESRASTGQESRAKEHEERKNRAKEERDQTGGDLKFSEINLRRRLDHALEI